MTTWTVPATVLRVVDADTCRLQLDLGWRITYTANARILGINAPELNTEEGRAARDCAAQLLPAGAQCTFTSKQLDKYGRPLGSLMLADGSDYAERLLALGFAERMG